MDRATRLAERQFLDAAAADAGGVLPVASPTRVPYQGGYKLRGRWLADAYTGLRNGAWAVRNSRVGNDFNPLALRLVVSEAQRLIGNGEALADVLEAFAELLSRP